MNAEDIKQIHWPSSCFACEVALKGVYFQADSFGPMMEVRSVMVKAEDQSCPFESGGEIADYIQNGNQLVC